MAAATISFPVPVSPVTSTGMSLGAMRRARSIASSITSEAVRISAHNVLERFSCTVETAHDGDEAYYMIRNAGSDSGYDVVISAIKLTDMTGYELLMKLRALNDPTALILMTGFGYDPGHTIVKARQAGLPANAILYKPFRLDQLLETVEGVIEAAGKVPQA